MIDISAPVKKKKVKKKKACGPRPTADSADDGVVMLSTFNNILSCLKCSFPIIKNYQKINQPLNLGKVFYPYFNRLIINFTEMAPILQRNYNIQGLFQYTELFLFMVHFAIKQKVLDENNLPDKENRFLQKLD